MKIILNLTDHYFTGDYPVKPIDELGDNKITQLSLLILHQIIKNENCKIYRNEKWN